MIKKKLDHLDETPNEGFQDFISTKFTVTLHKKNGQSKEDFKSDLDYFSDAVNQKGLNYAYIVHDLDEENGKVKPCHAHFVMWSTHRSRASTLVGQCFAEFYLGKSSDGKIRLSPLFGIRSVKSLQGAIRYLIHEDNPKKHQYDPLDVYTTSRDLVDLYLESTSNEFIYSASELYALAQGVSKRDYLCQFDPNYLNSHLRLLLEIWKDCNPFTK